MRAASMPKTSIRASAATDQFPRSVDGADAAPPEFGALLIAGFGISIVRHFFRVAVREPISSSSTRSHTTFLTIFGAASAGACGWATVWAAAGLAVMLKRANATNNLRMKTPVMIGPA